MRGSIVRLGSCAPIVATAIVWPAATLVAAVTIVSGPSRPASTLADVQAVGVGMFLDASRAAPTTTPVIAGRRSISATGKPSIARRSAIASDPSGSVDELAQPRLSERASL